MTINKTERGILRDAAADGGTILFPLAIPFLTKMRDRGLVTFRRVKSRVVVFATPFGRSLIA